MKNKMNKISSSESIMALKRSMLEISKREVEEGNYNRVIETCDKLRGLGVKARGIMNFIFSGYDYDNRELFMIPETRNYIRQMFVLYPELYYYVNLNGCRTSHLIYSNCTVQNLESLPDGRMYIELEDTVGPVEKICAAVNEYAVQIGDTDTMGIYYILKHIKGFGEPEEPNVTNKVQYPNERCSCGSDLKFKHCCGKRK